MPLRTFLSPDPEMGEPSDPKLRLPYAYCASDPVGNWDPTGRFFCGDEQKEAQKNPLGRLAVLLGYESVASMLMGRSRGERRPLAKAVKANVMRAKARAQRGRVLTEQSVYSTREKDSWITAPTLLPIDPTVKTENVGEELKIYKIYRKAGIWRSCP